MTVVQLQFSRDFCNNNKIYVDASLDNSSYDVIHSKTYNESVVTINLTNTINGMYVKVRSTCKPLSGSYVTSAAGSGSGEISDEQLAAIEAAIAAKQDELAFDNEPTANSNNVLTSGTIHTALTGKQDTINSSNKVDAGNVAVSNVNGIESTDVSGALAELNNDIAGKQDPITIDSTPTANSTNPVSSGGVHAALANIGGDTVQYSTMPEASASNLGSIIQYVGESTNDYTKGHFYECIYEEGNKENDTEGGYSWSRRYVQPSTTVDRFISANSTHPVQAQAISAALDTKQAKMQYDELPEASEDYLDKIVQYIGVTDDGIINGHFYKCVSDGEQDPTYSWEEAEVQTPSAGSGGDTIQYSTMPTTSADNLGHIVQYTGTTTASYTNGYFYICVSDGESTPTYSWERINVQPASASGSANQFEQEADITASDDGKVMQYIGTTNADETLINGHFYKIVYRSASCVLTWGTGRYTYIRYSGNSLTADYGCTITSDSESAFVDMLKRGITTADASVSGDNIQSWNVQSNGDSFYLDNTQEMEGEQWTISAQKVYFDAVEVQTPAKGVKVIPSIDNNNTELMELSDGDVFVVGDAGYSNLVKAGVVTTCNYSEVIINVTCSESSGSLVLTASDLENSTPFTKGDWTINSISDPNNILDQIFATKAANMLMHGNGQYGYYSEYDDELEFRKFSSDDWTTTDLKLSVWYFYAKEELPVYTLNSGDYTDVLQQVTQAGMFIIRDMTNGYSSETIIGTYSPYQNYRQPNRWCLYGHGWFATYEMMSFDNAPTRVAYVDLTSLDTSGEPKMACITDDTNIWGIYASFVNGYNATLYFGSNFNVYEGSIFVADDKVYTFSNADWAYVSLNSGKIYNSSGFEIGYLEYDNSTDTYTGHWYANSNTITFTAPSDGEDITYTYHYYDYQNVLQEAQYTANAPTSMFNRLEAIIKPVSKERLSHGNSWNGEGNFIITYGGEDAVIDGVQFVKGCKYERYYDTTNSAWAFRQLTVSKSDFDSLKNDVGDKSNLNTTTKTDIVSAINELANPTHWYDELGIGTTSISVVFPTEATSAGTAPLYVPVDNYYFDSTYCPFSASNVNTLTIAASYFQVSMSGGYAAITAGNGGIIWTATMSKALFLESGGTEAQWDLLFSNTGKIKLSVENTTIHGWTIFNGTISHIAQGVEMIIIKIDACNLTTATAGGGGGGVSIQFAYTD